MSEIVKSLKVDARLISQLGEALIDSNKMALMELIKNSSDADATICKINIDTDIRLAMTAAIRESIFKNPENFDPRGYLKPAREAVRQMVMHKIEAVVGSANTI